jgi:superfamily II DNA/RNA helicase
MKLVNAFGVESFTNEGHTKIEKMREIICDKHPDEKIVIHSTWARYIFPIWGYYMDQWKIPYSIYAGSSKQKTEILSKFRTDKNIRVLLSGDAGSDSVDIPEARVGINYNIPWKYTTLTQREGRRDRVTSSFDTIYTYSLIMPDSVDERKAKVCSEKYEYLDALFNGKVLDESISASISKDDLIYMLFG